MKKTAISMFIFFLFCGFANGQWLNFYSSDISRTKPFLISRVHYRNEDGGEQLYHTLEQAKAAFDDDAEFSLALRICSKNPLPVAFTTFNPSYQASVMVTSFSPDVLGKSGINLNKVFLLKPAKNCSGSWKNAAAEYWLIPKNSDFPEFSEIGSILDYCDSFKLNSAKYERKVLVESFKMGEKIFASDAANENNFLTPFNEFAFKLNLLKLLQKNRFSFILFEYPDSGRLKKSIFSKAVQLKQFLVKNNIRSARIVVDSCATARDECDFDSKTKHSIYPNITLIQQK